MERPACLRYVLTGKGKPACAEHCPLLPIAASLQMTDQLTAKSATEMVRKRLSADPKVVAEAYVTYGKIEEKVHAAFTQHEELYPHEDLFMGDCRQRIQTSSESE